MSKHTILTIGRQVGSGGREIGRRLAEQMGIPFYDKELIAQAAKKSGFSQEIFEEADEKAANSLLYSLVMGVYSATGSLRVTGDEPLVEQLFRVQSEVIREVADQGPCIIVGRCADYVLRNRADCASVFIHADMEFRCRRAVEQYGFSEYKIRERLQKEDKRRASYYNFYSGKEWGKAREYDITLSSSKIGIDNAVLLLEQYLKLR